MGQSVAELKAALRQRGIDFSTCREKAELMSLLQTALDQESQLAAPLSTETPARKLVSEEDDADRLERQDAAEEVAPVDANANSCTAAPDNAATTGSSSAADHSSLSVASLKKMLSALGVDFSACREKSELVALLEKAEEEKALQSPLENGGFCKHLASGRLCWVEFCTEGDALCHWDDGTDAIVPESGLEILDSLPTPSAFDGSFENARSHAFQQDMLLVAAVTGGGELTSSKPEATQALSLASEEIAELLQANAIFWSGPVSSLRGPHAMQLAPKGAPSLSMILPLATDAMKVLSTLQCTAKEEVLESFIVALQAQEEHRQAKEARLVSDTALLRQAQDEEYLAALAADKEQEAARAAAEVETGPQEEEEEEKLSEAQDGAQKRPQDSVAEEDRLAKHRRLMADEFLEAGSLEASGDTPIARLVLRLPSGGRVSRNFLATDEFNKVRRWVECCSWLPEASGLELCIPLEFELATAYPPRRFTSDDAGRNLQELGFVPSAALMLIDKTA